jgi:hypothetical protein
VRKYTAVSARTLACFLADARDPEAALCPHEPVRPVDSYAPSSFDQAKNTSLRRTSLVNQHADGHVAQKTVYVEQPTRLRRSINRTASLGSGDSHASQLPAPERLDSPQPSEQPAKDPKSFTQALFDALPVRLLEWMPRRPKRSPSHEFCFDSRQPSYGSDWEPRKEAVHRKPNVRGDGHKPASEGSKDEDTSRGATTTHLNGSVVVNGHAKEPINATLGRQLSIKALSNDTHGARARPFEETEQTSASSHEISTTSKQQQINMDAEPHNGMETVPVAGSEQSVPTSGNLNDETQGEEPQKLSGEFDNSDRLSGSNPTPQQSSTFGTLENKFSLVPTLALLSTDILKELRNLSRKTRKDLFRPSPSDFFRQSLFYCLKDPYRLSASFESPGSPGVEPHLLSSAEQRSWHSKLDIGHLGINFATMFVLSSRHEVIRNLSIAIHSLYIPSRSRRPQYPTSLLDDQLAARVCAIGLYALSELVQSGTDLQDFALPELFDQLRARGKIQSFRDEVVDLERQPASYSTLLRTYHTEVPINAQNKHVLQLCDAFDDFIPYILLEEIVGVVANRWTHWEISRARNNTDLGRHRSKAPSMVQLLLEYMADDTKQRQNIRAVMESANRRSGQDRQIPESLRTGFLSRLTLSWLRTLMLRDWDGQASIRKSNTVGIILQILAAMYEQRCSIGLDPAEFWTPLFVRRLDALDMPMEWLAFRPDNKTVHLLSYSFLFPPETVVAYFRAINYSRMMKTSEGKLLTKRTYGEFIASGRVPVTRRERLEQRLEIPGAWRFVIEVRRDNVLTDAINQIWRRPAHELLRPLKVRMGTDEGEEGVDSGGVQQELFRILFGQALDPSYGMFTVDEQTRMIWFQPESLEPLFKFEALGILMSLAVYNSITLPITFPIAFYRKLLGLKVKKLDHIRDGWSTLAENLQGLLDWKDGDVADVHMRTYEFSYEAFGKIVSIDMEKHSRDVPWPPAPNKKGKERAKTASFDVPPVEASEEEAIHVSAPSISRVNEPALDSGPQDESVEASLVTNANREQYVKDYIFWLTDKSVRPQYEAFARGFYTCLDRTALSIFTAEALQSFVEGVQEIDIDGLQESAVYQEYTADHQVVRWFWEVVKSWDHRKQKLLLEFVTASDRIPVSGVGAVGFGVQNNGPRDERLPSSMTCFGMLLLPEYSSKEVLERMLNIAIEHSKGFGTA